MIERAEFFSIAAHIFVPTALGFTIGVAEAKALKVKMVVEGTIGPTYPEAEDILLGKGIDLIPTSSATRAASSSRTTSGCRTSAPSSGSSTTCSSDSSAHLPAG